MTAVLLNLLFAAAGLFALLSITGNLRRYGTAALAIREELRRCDDWREVRVTVCEVTVRPAGATVLRPDFKARPRPRHVQPALPAAA